MLSTIEKKDAEELSLLRNKHETNLNKAILEVQDKNIVQADLAKKGLEKAKEVTLHRKEFYENRKRLSIFEKFRVDYLTGSGKNMKASNALRGISKVVSIIPQFDSGIEGMGSSPTLYLDIGGQQLSALIDSIAIMFSTKSAIQSNSSSIFAYIAQLYRTIEDWDFQKENAVKELSKIEVNIKEAEIRKEIAELEKKNHELKVKQYEEVGNFMEDKFTNIELYQWLKSSLSDLYFSTYQLAYKMAKQAEKTYGFELGIETPSFISFGYWNNLTQGLLSGEKLYKDLQRMEAAYMEQNEREYELTRHFSIANLNPEQILNLRETGVCDFDLPEIAYDMDHPSHYFRRIKSVKVTIPCVTGNYTNITAKLTMLSNYTRKSNIISGTVYIDAGNYRHNLTGIQSIATSSAENDSGLFQLNFNDERYLPFEGAGAISSWRLELPQEFHQFDYNTIVDVILTVDYTAREGGDGFGETAATYWKDNVGALLDSITGLPRLFSLKTEFPTEFHQFLNLPDTQSYHETILNITWHHLSYFLKNRTLKIKNLKILLKPKEDETWNISDFNDNDFFEIDLGDTGSYAGHSNNSFSREYNNHIAVVQLDNVIENELVVNPWVFKITKQKDLQGFQNLEGLKNMNHATRR